MSLWISPFCMMSFQLHQALGSQSAYLPPAQISTSLNSRCRMTPNQTLRAMREGLEGILVYCVTAALIRPWLAINEIGSLSTCKDSLKTVQFGILLLLPIMIMYLSGFCWLFDHCPSEKVFWQLLALSLLLGHVKDISICLSLLMKYVSKSCVMTIHYSRIYSQQCTYQSP